MVKLKRQINTLREEVAESGEKLGYSNAVAETYRLKAESASSEFEDNNMLLRVSASSESLEEKYGQICPEL